jgi:transposase
MNSNNTIIIGVDVAKDKLDVMLSPMGEHKVIANCAQSIKRWLLELKHSYAIELLVLEATGGYEQTCRKQCDRLGIPVHVAHPNQVHHFALAHKLYAKSDKIDAKTLARFGEQTHVQATPPEHPADKALQELVQRKQQLTDNLIREKQRLNPPGLSKPYQRSLKRSIKQTEKEIELINIDLEKSIQRDEKKAAQVKRLCTYKGVGVATAITVIAYIPELGQLSRAATANLVGLAPINKDSGQKQGYRSIRGGRFYARKALYMAALSAIRFNPAMKSFYKKLRDKGKKAKVAITAVMRKIIITLNAMIKNKTDWQPC